MTRFALTLLAASSLVACSDMELHTGEDAAEISAQEFDADIDLRIDVYPPGVLGDGSTVDLLDQSFRGVGASTGWDVSLPLQDAVRLNGELSGFIVNDHTAVGVPGHVERIAGVFEASVPDTIMARSVATDADGEFRLDVVPNAAYTLAWIPDAQYGLPFLVTTSEELLSDADLSVELDEGLLLYGNVTYGEDALPAPFGAVVQPVDLATGIAGPITDVDASGAYFVRLYPGDYELRVWHPDNLFFPEQSLVVSMGEADGTRQDVHYATLNTPTVVSEVHDEDGAPRPSVAVRIVSTEITGSPDASLVVDTETGPNGLFAARLVPGVYDIQLIPSYEAQVGPTLIEDVVIESDSDLGVVTVPWRPVVEGAVVGPQGAPVPNTLVRASETGFDGFVYETTTDETGQFVLPVSDDLLRWTFEPPADAGLATTFVDADPTDVLVDDRVEIAAGERITGTVTWRGEPVPYAVVDVRDDQDRLFATASTDADGVFEVRVDVSGGR